MDGAKRLRALAFLGLTVALLACSDESLAPATPQELTVIGVAGGADDDTLLAIVFDGDALVAYSCGGDATFAKNTHWFSAEADSEGAFSAQSGGWTLTGRRVGAEAEGELLDPEGARLAFRAEAVALSGPGGLYVADGTACDTGVIVRPTAAAPTVQGSACDDSGARFQVTPVRPEEVSARGFAVWVEEGGARRRVQVARLAL